MLKNYVLGALACIVMGVALIVNPHIITDVLNTAIGVILIAWAAVGILRFVFSRANDTDGSVGFFSLISNIIILIAGIYVFINTSLLEKIVMLALGLYLLFSGIPKIIASFRIKKMSEDGWLLPMVTAAASTLLGALIVCSPTKVSGAFMRFIGVALAIAGAVSFISGFSGTRMYEKLEKDIRYSGGRGRDTKDTSAEDKANAIDVEADDQ